MIEQMEDRYRQTRSLATAAFGIGAALASMTWLFGVSPILTATITLCYVIIVISGLGCSLHLREIELLETAQETSRQRNLVDDQMLRIGSLVESVRERLTTFQNIADDSANSESEFSERVRRAQLFLLALDDRFQQLLILSSDNSESALREAAAVAAEPLRVPTTGLGLVLASNDDTIGDGSDADGIQSLNSDGWDGALSSLLGGIEVEYARLREKAA